MRAAFLTLALVLASGAEAQKIRLTPPAGGGGATVFGASGVRTTPQASPAALSACAALAGAWASATPVSEAVPTGYFCNGVRWARVWTDEDGNPAHPEKSLAAYTFVSQARAGEFAFKANNRAVWDLGDGVNDEIVSLGNRLQMGSIEIRGGGSVTADIISQTDATKNLTLFPLVSAPKWVRIFPLGSSTCTADDSGGIQARSGDSNRLYQCDGTNAFRMSRALTVPVTFDFPPVPNGTCTTANVTVAGAAVGDTISVNADFALPLTIGIGNARSTGTDTVSLRLCNHDPTNSQDPDSGTYRFRIER